MAAPARPRTVAELLARAHAIGLELAELSQWQASRLTRQAWISEAERIAGGRAALDAARERIAGKRYVNGLIDRIARQWLDGRWVDRPAPHGAFENLEVETAAAVEALHNGIDAALGGALVGLAVAEHPDASFGHCPAPGAGAERVSVLRAELRELEAELAKVIRLEDLVIERATIAANGRTYPWSTGTPLAQFVADVAPIPADQMPRAA